MLLRSTTEKWSDLRVPQLSPYRVARREPGALVLADPDGDSTDDAGSATPSP
jgi:hypothetical protein